MDELKFKIKLFLICSVISVLAYSQNSSNGYKSGIAGILNAPNPEDIGVRTSVQIQEDEDGPLEYGFVDDNDILWSTMVWEIIDLNQKVNFPLLYPTDLDVVGDERRPMLWWLRQEIEAGKLKIYDEGVDDGNFINPVEEKDIANIFSTYKIFKEAEDEYLGENITITLRDTLDFQKESLGFDPYENPDGDERKIAFANDALNKVLFPHSIKDPGTAKKVGAEELTYSDFLDFEENETDPSIYDLNKKSGYNEALQEIIENKLFIEGEHYEYEQVEYSDIIYYRVKGMWYFDKKYSELIYRPIAIAPVRKAENLAGNDDDEEDDEYDPVAELRGEGMDSDGDGVEDDQELDSWFTDPEKVDTDGDGVNDNIEILLADSLDEEDLATNSDITPTQEQIDEFFNELTSDETNDEDEEDSVEEVDGFGGFTMFWVYYPHAREILQKGQAFNNRNLSQSISFDDIINSRRFQSLIYKEENVYENREVKDYIKNNSFMRLLESERIKEKIRNFEHDMWSW